MHKETSAAPHPHHHLHGADSAPSVTGATASATHQSHSVDAPCAAPAAKTQAASARTPGAPRIAISCCPPDSTSSSACAPSAGTAAAHDHASHAAGEGHGEHSDHGGHGGHDHSALPGWGRIGAALLAATGAELLHLIGPDTTLWHGASMVLAAAAILLAGLELQALEQDLRALRGRCDGTDVHCHTLDALHAQADAQVEGLPASAVPKRHV